MRTLAIDNQDELDPVSTKVKLLKELAKHMRGGMAEDLHSKHNPKASSVLEIDMTSLEPDESPKDMMKKGVEVVKDAGDEIESQEEKKFEDSLENLDDETLDALLGK